MQDPLSHQIKYQNEIVSQEPCLYDTCIYQKRSQKLICFFPGWNIQGQAKAEQAFSQTSRAL